MTSRRHFLRGMGVALALPWMESLPLLGQVPAAVCRAYAELVGQERVRANLQVSIAAARQRREALDADPAGAPV
mgnify:CR=1 FL=1